MPVTYSDRSAGPSTRRTTPTSPAVEDGNAVDVWTKAKFTKKELQEVAEARGLDTSGTKAQLIARLDG